MEFQDNTLLDDRVKLGTLKAEVAEPILEKNLGRMPVWLRRRMGLQHGFLGLLRVCEELNGLLDHWGTATIGGRRCLVSEPYDMQLERLERLVNFCHRYNCRCNISATSFHFPTRTVRIIISDNEDKTII